MSETQTTDGIKNESDLDDLQATKRLNGLSLSDNNTNTPTLNLLQANVEELYTFNKSSLEDNLENQSSNKIILKEKIQQVIQLMKDNEVSAIAENKAHYYFLLGKTGSVIHPVTEECINAFSKAVKLNPAHLDAWNSLGECLVHLKRYSEAKYCFLASLKHGKSKVILRNLSIIMRETQLLTNENMRESLEAGIEYAKEAVELDSSDGESWTILGNAYLSLFFRKQEDKLLRQSINSFEKALQDPAAAKNADLHFNRGVALKYGEIYTDALASFEKASLLDPQWTIAKDTLEDLIKYLKSTQTLYQRKGQMKSKRLKQMTDSLDTSCLGLYKDKIKSMKGEVVLKPSPISQLEVGLNIDKVVCGRVVCVVYNQEPVPYTFCLVDKELACIVVSVYNLAQGKGPIIGDSVAIPEPYMSKIEATYKDQKYAYPSIRVNLPLTVIVNKKCISSECVCQPQFLSKQF
ncbi:tetratricopeptide repeat protein 5-like [Adelges cooleyi]|uniref:tetratricopeptide repeat protein 5-like n=1 Tax=Adelges cooleyi TaxID=133065 RepID=UPI00217F99B3|nr:tetratricopeptide repeat protein 5-like [Adelges cooleyi]XP_050441437.1 tetratricopeptide repeat protein 5-like [Adelges cooleyi]